MGGPCPARRCEITAFIGKSNERDRRPSQDELDRLIGYTESNAQQYLPLGRIVRFAVATAMRQAEICRIEWSDVDMSKRTVTIRDRKDPRRKDGNDQVVPLLNSTGYDAWQIMLEQRILTRGLGRVFPYHSKSVGAAFRRSCSAINFGMSLSRTLWPKLTLRRRPREVSYRSTTQIACVNSRVLLRRSRQYSCQMRAPLHFCNLSLHRTRHARREASGCGSRMN
ncbi:tyrosine-type recombinase/integrase [Bradyrhizobium sp. Leo121]|uniref:tyrosine-type recombinase/integrase n=1 Tax=Bradyrhizobium sp. Leo121 TaxID=1571195 RepID=UPI001FE22CC3|nr:tyrosine-type recombinase/integrase [Bradyrhizobium sp. Leo121]